MKNNFKTYRRPIDGLLMVEIGPGHAVNVTSARRLGLIPGRTKFDEPDQVLPEEAHGTESAHG